MCPRINYEITEADAGAILEAWNAAPPMVILGHTPRSNQDNVNDVWRRIGEKMGFDHTTVKPILSKEGLFFSAIPNETEDVLAERMAKRVKIARDEYIARLEREIAERQSTLNGLRAEREG